MPATTMVHVRVDQDTKEQAAATLAAMGLTVSDAVRVFLMRVVADQAMPFSIEVPNAKTQAAMSEAREIIRTRRDRFATAGAMMHELDKKNLG